MPLKGLQVVELGGFGVAPFCGMILADFGASVIKVSRTTPKEFEKFECLSNGKKSIAIDLKNPKGAEVLRSLCRQSDVLIEPFRKGIMEKLGLGPQVLQEDNPRLVYARITGFGQFGKYSDMAGHDINFLSVSGLLSMIGRSGEKPIPPLNLVAGFGGGGLMSTFGILTALLERSKSGKGQVIDANMVEGAAYLGSWFFRSQHYDFIWGKPRGNNIMDSGSHFYDTYETKDGKFVAVGALEPEFYEQLIKGLDISKNDVPQFGDFAQAKKVFSEKFKSKTQEEWCQIFDLSDACVTPVLSLREAANHPTSSERQSFTMFADTSEKLAPVPAPILNRTPGLSKAGYRSPVEGEHTYEILSSLNYSNEDIQLLIQNKVVKISESHS